MTFKKGQSGNRGGRPKGARNKTTIAREEMEEHLPAIMKKLYTSAERGSFRHAKLILDRVIPPVKIQDMPVKLRLRGSIEAKAQTIVNAVSDSRITPDEGIKLMTLLMNQAKIIEVNEFAERLEAIERMLSNESN